MTSRRPDDAARLIARTQRALAGYALKGHRHDGPLGVVGLATVTSSRQTSSSTWPSFGDISGLTVTIDSAANRRIKISMTIAFMSHSTGSTDGRVELAITDGNNSLLQTRWHRFGSTNAEGGGTFHAVDAPSAGTKTYKGRWRTPGGTVVANADTSSPISLLVEDIGPA